MGVSLPHHHARRREGVASFRGFPDDDNVAVTLACGRQSVRKGRVFASVLLRNPDCCAVVGNVFYAYIRALLEKRTAWKENKKARKCNAQSRERTRGIHEVS